MTPLEKQLEDLRQFRGGANARKLPSGAHLITVPDVQLPAGWNQKSVTVLFLAPPGYPGAQPDCFWAHPHLRLANGTTPNATNDSNPIPEVGPSGTWFSWHVQQWNPNRDSLVTFFNVVMARLRTLR